MITLDLTPTEEAEIRTIARQTGLAPADYLKRLVKEHLPSVTTSLAPTIDEENAAAIAQLQAWKIEEASNDPDEIHQAEADLNELILNLNRNRIESGERPLLPPAVLPAPLPEQDSEEKRAAAVALLESWIAALPTDPEEIRQADAERNEFLQNLN